MNKLMTTLIALGASAWLAAGPAQAAGDAAFTCGGVGEADQQRMKAQAAQHDAMLTFATASGAYVADVDVLITDARGRTVLEGRCDGPLMLVDLPGQGSWRVTASYGGQVQRKNLVVGGRTARATFFWPEG